MIGVATAEFGRYAVFHDYLNLLEKPEGTICTLTHGQSPAKARNLIIEAALEHDCTHILILDDDMVIPPDTLKRLLARDLDIVSAYYLMRNYPHQGIIFDKAEPDGKCYWYEVRDDETDLVEVVATGFGCVLIKIDVFHKLKQPWVRLGEIESDGWCDDIGFFKRVREAGIKIFIDMACPVGHIANMSITPVRKDNKWYVSYTSFGSSESVAFPMIRSNNGPERKK